LKKTLNNNATNPIVKKIHLFLDKNEDEDYIKTLPLEIQAKIKIIEVGKQPLYSDLFQYANTLPNEICMVCNGDIWVYNKQIPFFFKVLNNNFVFALTRHEIDGKRPLIEIKLASHDAFVFKSQLNPSLQKMVQHKQNIWGSENRVIDSLLYLKYNLVNPCIEFKIIHEHDFKRPNRIEPNRDRLSHNNNSIVPSQSIISNGKIYFKSYISPTFRLNI
ncbi:MAG: hypothetical protein WD512_15875, partial [Candidatus Paceibacterota bacterium]